MILLMCGCSDNTNSLVESNYLNKNNYNTIYSDFKKVTNDIAYIPSKETEKSFYEMIEIISDNCDYFKKDELNNLYQLINRDYQFKYSSNRYTNEDYQKDLNAINMCLAE